MNPKRLLQFSFAGLTAVATATYGLNVSQAATPSGFLARSGSQLLLNGSPYTYVSFNAYGMTGQETGTPYSRAVDDAYFASLPVNSLTRTWAWPGNSRTGIDTVVKSAEANNQMVILSLSNGAGFDDTPNRTEAWYQTTYKTEVLPGVRELVAKYKDSKAIGMWEIMNEPGNTSHTSGSVSNATMKAFFDDMAATIKSIDPNHLVETGTMDANEAGTSDFGNLHSGANIDVASIHDYADEYEGGVLVSGNYTQAASALKDAGMNKPIIVGEVGVRGADSGCVHTRDQRATIFKQKFDAYFKAGVVGLNIWNWYPTKYNNCANGESIYAGDPVMSVVKNYKTASSNSVTTKPTMTTVKPATSSTTAKPCTSAPATAFPALSTLLTIPPITSGSIAKVYDDKDAALKYSGRWEESASSGKSGGSDHYTYEVGAQVSLTFSGSTVQVFSVKAAHHGTAEVSIDGKNVASISEYAQSRSDNQLIFSTTLASGNHILRISNTSPEDSDPWNGVIALDRVVVK